MGGGVSRGAALGPMLKSLHRGHTPDSTPPPRTASRSKETGACITGSNIIYTMSPLQTVRRC